MASILHFPSRPTPADRGAGNHSSSGATPFPVRSTGADTIASSPAAACNRGDELNPSPDAGAKKSGSLIMLDGLVDLVDEIRAAPVSHAFVAVLTIVLWTLALILPTMVLS